ncbi:SDR family oxidoreductase [Arthrobacter gandavensis]|uniref:SDR family NAD(P)-dependent oxidoreductase n=1 Tax=Arthrobacter gandavensis TaxID=169960 RepID=UPI00188EDFE6|nr:SDR family NAD(P)-dependent oxidoreductase [Arthrobacter gandavensis]MBF4995070.1 SDR family oxidoreductase [Arthrobacter gandavensis]
MPADPDQLSTESLISQWLEHPSGRAILLDVLARRGPDVRAIYALQNLPLSSIVTLSRGNVTTEQLELLAEAANRGVTETPPNPELSHLFPSAPPPSPLNWKEGIIPGRFRGKTVIVTGAGSGIGRAVALRLGREDAHVIAVDLNTLRMEALLENPAARGTTGVVADLSREEDIQRIITAAGADIDGLTLVGGLADDMEPLHEVDDDLWERIFRVNVTGPFRLSRRVIPLMLSRGTGAIVNLASQAGLRGSIGGAAYTAAKHAVLGLTRSEAYTYTPRGLRINAVVPMPTRNTLDSNYGFPGGLGPMPAASLIPSDLEAAAVAAPVTYLLSDDAIAVTGAILPADEGWSVG